jgi:integrase
LHPRELSQAHALEINQALKVSGWAHTTKYVRSAAVRQILRMLWEEHGAPKIDQHITRYAAPSPRNVTAERSEIDALLGHAAPHMRLWLLLCSDLAIRSGTATRIAPQNYRPQARTLQFTTKYRETATLPVTEELRALIETCDLNDPTPLVRQLWIRAHNPRARLRSNTSDRQMSIQLRTQFRQLLKDVNITRRITPHDLRRTTATAMYRATRDVREVQALLTHKRLNSTIWYLDHNLTPVSRPTLELIKRPPAAESEDRTA